MSTPGRSNVLIAEPFKGEGLPVSMAGRSPVPMPEPFQGEGIPASRHGSVTTGVVEAAALGVQRCESCALVLPVEAGTPEPRCPRCGAALHWRKPRSLERTAAWLVTAVLLYIPANLLPVMSTRSALGDHAHTLVGGIRDLWVEGSQELALIVFVASIVVPIGKIAALVVLAWSAARGSLWRQQERARLYRLVETVGHWSMLDVFVVVLLVGMVRFGAIAGVEPEAGLAAFGGVVVATMLAAAAFDPRLIWPSAAAAREVHA